MLLIEALDAATEEVSTPDERPTRAARCADAFRFVKPYGTGFDSAAMGSTTLLGDWRQLSGGGDGEGVAIDSSTAVTRWRGERMDYGIAVEALLARSRGGHSRGNVSVS